MRPHFTLMMFLLLALSSSFQEKIVPDVRETLLPSPAADVGLLRWLSMVIEELRLQHLVFRTVVIFLSAFFLPIRYPTYSSRDSPSSGVNPVKSASHRRARSAPPPPTKSCLPSPNRSAPPGRRLSR